MFREVGYAGGYGDGGRLTPVKLMVGKAVAKSDETYIAKAKLDEAFMKVSKYLNVTGVEEKEKSLQEMIVFLDENRRS